MPQSLNGLIARISKRASELADLPIDQLRLGYPEVTETGAELLRHCKQSRFSRGEMIDAILLEEFSDEEVE